MTAVCLILLAIAVTALIKVPPGLVPRAQVLRKLIPQGRWVCAAAALAAVLIAAVCLLGYALDRRLPLDDLLFGRAVARELDGGRMALSSALELILIALAVLAASRGRRTIAQALGLVAFTVAAVAVLGYAYGERRLYASDAQTGMAVNTALGLSLVAVALLAAIPDGVLSQLFKRPAPGALLSRRLLPWITIVMPVIGWLRIEGERRGWFGSALGTAIMVFAGSILVTVVAQMAAVSMDRLAVALNHAWHQYGLVSADHQSRTVLLQRRIPAPELEPEPERLLSLPEDRV
jgi:hypothetical protein